MRFPYFIFSILFVLCTSLTGCSNNDVFEPVQDAVSDNVGVAITGEIYSKAGSRVNSTTVDEIKRTGFELYIYEKYDQPVDGKDSVLFFTTTITPSEIKTDGTFVLTKNGDTSESLNWPMDKNLVFVAMYLPKVSGTNLCGFEYQEGHVGVGSNTNDGSADVLYATATGKYSSSTPQTVPELKLSFSHMMTQISASIKAPDDLYTYVIDGITAVALSPKAYWHNAASDEKIEKNKGVFDVKNNVWKTSNQVYRNEMTLFVEGQSKTVATTTAADLGESRFVIPFSLPAASEGTVDLWGDSGKEGQIYRTTGDTICKLNIIYSVYEKTDATYETPRLNRKKVVADVTSSLGINKNVKFNITLPTLSVAGGTIDVDPWGDSDDEPVSNLQ